MESTRRVVLELDVMTSDRQPIAGLVRTRDGLAHAFSGWSEMFAVLERLTAVPGDDTEREDGT
ncbi:MAG TPA: hypothetical protein VF940_05120 [Streptosporangiaceae bacterium]